MNLTENAREFGVASSQETDRLTSITLQLRSTELPHGCKIKSKAAGASSIDR
jgi:hypothetical protein